MLAYGESYSLKGTTTTKNIDIPLQMKNVIDKAEEESFLNYHCDDEPAIIADSCIVTLSFGSKKKNHI